MTAGIASTATGSKDFMNATNSIFDPINVTLSKELYTSTYEEINNDEASFKM